MIAFTAACTRPNPDYCADTSECTNGLVCDLSSNRCVDSPVDAAQPDADGRRCDPTAPFQEPVLQTDLSSSLDEADLTLSADENIAVLHRFDSIPLLMAARNDRNSPFTFAPEPNALTPLQAGSDFEVFPDLSGDALSIYFERTVITANPSYYSLFVATRSGPSGSFDEGRRITVDHVSLTGEGGFPQLSRDGQTIYWTDYVQLILYSATRTAGPSIFESRMQATTMKISPSYVIGGDDLALYYSVDDDVFVSSRTSRDVPFEPGVPVTQVNSDRHDQPVAVTDDDCLLYLASDRLGGVGGTDIWLARRGH